MTMRRRAALQAVVWGGYVAISLAMLASFQPLTGSFVFVMVALGALLWAASEGLRAIALRQAWLEGSTRALLLRLALLTAFAYGVGQALGYTGWPLLLALWFGGYATGFWAVFRLRGYCEHVGAHTLSLCEPSPLWRFFVFPHGAWAHQLHHEMPGLPFHRYRDVLRRRGSLGISPGDVFRLFESSPPLASGEVPAVDADANLMRRASLQGLLRTAVIDEQAPRLAAAMEER